MGALQMQAEGEIGLYQGVILVYVVLGARLFIQFPTFLIRGGSTAGWQAALVMTAVGMAMFWPSGALARRFPHKNLTTIAEEVLGSFLGGLISFGVALWLLVEVVIGFRLFTETFIVTILPNTPPLVLTTVSVICVGFASYKGIESMARAIQILFPLVIIGVLIILILDLQIAEPSRLAPYWGYGFAVTWRTGFHYASVVSEVLVLIVLGNSFGLPKHLVRGGLGGILLFGVTTAITVSMLVMVFGSLDSAQQSFPLFNLARLIYLGRFLQRVESLVVMFWFFTVAIRISILFHASIVTLTGTFHLPEYRPLIFPILAIIMVCSQIPKDFVRVVYLDQFWVHTVGFSALAVPLLLLLVALLRRKGGDSHAA
jgi:spore germination protein KB